MNGRLGLLGAGAVVLSLASAGTGAASPNATAATTAAAASQCSTSISALRPHYPNPIKKLSGAATSLSGAGSSWANPYISLWASAYAKTGTKIVYQAIGSGGGVAQIQAKTVDFGASDVPMTPTEQQGAKGGPILHIPMALGAVVIAYHVKGVNAGLKFDGETIGKIFTGDIKTWNDPAIKALNPGVNLPNEPIAVAHRSDSSGTTGVFSDYLTKVSKTWVSKLGGADKSRGKTIAWPTGIGGKGNDGVSAIVSQTEGGVGYVELQYAVAQHLTYGVVKNSVGTFITPCPTTITAAANKTFFPPNLKTSLTNRPGALAYPITGTTYALVYQNQTDEPKAKALVNFLAWALTTGQNFPGSINYAALGKSLQVKALGQIGKITLNGKPLVTVPGT
jgi:phosphate transport system substrate-binding protein